MGIQIRSHFLSSRPFISCLQIKTWGPKNSQQKLGVKSPGLSQHSSGGCLAVVFCFPHFEKTITPPWRYKPSPQKSKVGETLSQSHIQGGIFATFTLVTCRHGDSGQKRPNFYETKLKLFQNPGTISSKLDGTSYPCEWLIAR